MGACFLLGCEQTELDSVYGRRAGTPGGESVNGTAVLADMFEQAGHHVRSWRRLSPSLERAETIVWFPDDFDPPKEEVRVWLEQWLHDQPGRTLIYVGRDYDAAPDYWKQVKPDAPPEQQQEIARRQREAESEFAAERNSIPDDEDCTWFTVDTDPPPREVKSLSGPWSQGVDASQADIELHSRYIPQTWDEVLLESQGDALVTRLAYENLNQGQFIVVTNGSFLLNMKLVNHENRKLAGRLVDSAGPPGRVVFLESGRGGPPIYDEEPAAQTPVGLEVFKVWPLNFVLLHLALLGVVFLFTRWPIFGLPRRLPQPPLSDFGRHVQALGELLGGTRNRNYAVDRIRYYHHVTAGDTTSRHRAPRAAQPVSPPPSTPN